MTRPFEGEPESKRLPASDAREHFARKLVPKEHAGLQAPGIKKWPEIADVGGNAAVPGGRSTENATIRPCSEGALQYDSPAKFELGARCTPTYEGRGTRTDSEPQE